MATLGRRDSILRSVLLATVVGLAVAVLIVTTFLWAAPRVFEWYLGG